jgi:hypothetical protein
MRQESKYEYTNTGLLSRRIIMSNEAGERKDESEFDYDTAGHLVTEKKIVDKKVVNEISYLFDETNKLVKSHVNRDFKNASIGIVKYAYTFY